MKSRFLPFLNWKVSPKKELKHDAVSGLTVALLIIPQSMAYAELAGLPPVVGLYASFLPVIIGGLFGSLGQLATGPVAMTSMLTASALSVYASTGASTQELVFMAAILALQAGVILLLAGVFKLSFIVNFVSHPVISGFTSAAALIIGLSQVDKLFGIPVDADDSIGFISSLFSTFSNITTAHVPTLIVGSGSLLLLFFLKKYTPKAPGLLIVATIATVGSYLSGFQELGGNVVGVIPEGLPSFGFPCAGTTVESLSALFMKLLPEAVIIATIGFVEVLAISKAISMHTKQSLDLDQELIGQGLASISAGLSHGYPTSGSFSRTAVNLSSGAKTGMSSVYTGLIVALTLLFFTPLLHHLPKATLAAGILMAVIRLVDIKPIIHSWKIDRSDGVAAVVTFVLALSFAPKVEQAIIVGIVLSLALHIYRTMKPQVSVLSMHEDGTLQDANEFNLTRSEHIIPIRFDESLYFASVSHFENSIINALAEQPEAKFILVVADGINRIDASGEVALRQLLERLQENGITLVFSGLQNKALSVIKGSGLYDEVGAENFYSRPELAISDIHQKIGLSADGTQYSPLYNI